MNDLRKHLIRLGNQRRDLREHIRPVLRFLKRAYKDGDYGDQSRNEAFYPEGGSGDEPNMVSAYKDGDYGDQSRNEAFYPEGGSTGDTVEASFGPKRMAAQYRYPIFKKLQNALDLWAHRYNSKFMGEPVYASVESRGTMEGSGDHPTWSVTIMEEHDPVDPLVRGVFIEGDAHDPDWLKLSYSQRYGSDWKPRGATKSKELYDWSPRDVIALMDRWL